MTTTKKLTAQDRGGFFTREEAEGFLEGSQDERLIGGIAKQRQFLANEWLIPLPCPNCGNPLPVVDARHIEGDHFECVHCPAKLRYIIPLVATGPALHEWAVEPGQIT